jgi:hypothetical protein
VDRTHTADKAQALRAVTDGARGCRKAGAYMFCVGPDGVMSTRSNPVLRGRDPHDRTGNHSVRTMMDAAGPGRISVIRSLFPTLGSTVEEPKTTYCTCTGDHTCGVGAYGTDIVAPAIASPDRWSPSFARGSTRKFRVAPMRTGSLSWMRATRRVTKRRWRSLGRVAT